MNLIFYLLLLILPLKPQHLTVKSLDEMSRTYYISTSGSDSNSGLSKNKAFKSIEKVNSLNLRPGDEVLFKAGDVWVGSAGLNPKGSGTANLPIVIGKYGKGNFPIIRIEEGTDNAITINGDSFVEIKELEVNSKNHNGIAVNGKTNTKVEGIRINGVKALNCSPHLGQREFDNCGIRIGSHSKGSNVENTWFVNCIIENCTVDNCAVGIMISGNKFDETQPVRLTDPISQNCHIRNCTVGNICGDGVVIFCAANVSIEHTSCFNACKYNADNKATAGIWLWNVRNGAIRYCESYGHIAPGIDRNPFDTDYESYNTVIEYNYGHDCYGAAILMCAPKGTNNNTVVRYNVFENCGMDDSRESAFIKFYDCETDQNRYIYNNTFIGSPTYLITSLKDKAYCHIFNNIFYHTNGLDYNAKPVLKAGSQNFFTKILMPGYHSNNLYFNISGIQDEPGAVFDDPLFNSLKYKVGYKKSGLRLTKNSPAINAGRVFDRSIFEADDPTFFNHKGKWSEKDRMPDIGALK